MLFKCEIQNNYLYYYNNMIILNSKSLYFKILEFVHDAAIISHPGRAKTYEIIQRFYY